MQGKTGFIFTQNRVRSDDVDVIEWDKNHRLPNTKLFLQTLNNVFINLTHSFCKLDSTTQFLLT